MSRRGEQWIAGNQCALVEDLEAVATPRPRLPAPWVPAPLPRPAPAASVVVSVGDAAASATAATVPEAGSATVAGATASALRTAVWRRPTRLRAPVAGAWRLAGMIRTVTGAVGVAASTVVRQAATGNRCGRATRTTASASAIGSGSETVIGNATGLGTVIAIGTETGTGIGIGIGDETIIGVEVMTIGTEVMTTTTPGSAIATETTTMILAARDAISGTDTPDSLAADILDLSATPFFKARPRRLDTAQSDRTVYVHAIVCLRRRASARYLISFACSTGLLALSLHYSSCLCELLYRLISFFFFRSVYSGG